MEKEKIQSGFEAWLQSEKGIDANSYSLYQAAVIESVERFLNSKYNDVPFHEHYSTLEHNSIMFDTWKHTVELMLKNTDLSMTYKGVKISEYREIKDELLNQIQNIQP